MLIRTSMLLSASAIGLLLNSAPAAAQEPPAPAAEPVAASPGEIIVTARKRQESILKVPVVETVLSGELVDRYQVTNLSSIATKVPGLSLGNQVLTIGTQVSIRGVGTTTLDAGVDQSVSLNIDGLQLTQGLAFQAGMFDLTQIEVLKGPQALFYGKNSPGGVIAIHTADPGPEAEFSLRSGYDFEGREWRNEAIASGPVTDTLGVRLAAMYSDSDGYFRNRAIANTAIGGQQARSSRFGATKSLILRGTVIFKPTPEFTMRLKANYARDRQQGGAVTQFVSCPDGTAPLIPTLDFLAGEDCKLDRTLNLSDIDPTAFPGVPNNGRTFQNNTQRFGTLEMGYDVTDALTLTSTTGYYHLHGDGLIQGTTTPAATPFSSYNEAYRRDFTQELRLDSDFTGPINVSLGGFYQNSRLSNRLDLITNRKLGLPLPPRLGNNKSTLDIEAASLFGQVRWKVTPQLELAGGVRWTDETRTDEVVGLATGTAIPIALADPDDPTNPDKYTFKPEISSNNLSPEFTITYTPTDDLTLYGSYKQGYKSGSFSISRILSTGVDPSFGDEEVRGGELGLKMRSADRALYLNLAGYYYKYKGLQVGVSLPTTPGNAPQNTTINAGSARIYGLDFDLTYRSPLIEGLSLRAAVNWNHARFTDLVGVPCYGGQTIANGCDQVFNPVTGLYTAQDLTGDRLVRAPDWQATFGADYDLPIAGGKSLQFGVDGQYSSKYLTLLGDRADFYQRDFVKLNGSITLRGRDNRWEIALIGNNLTDQVTSGSCTNINAQAGQVLGGQITGGTGVGPAGTDEIMCRVDRGRELWTRATIRF
jgi:iron complex outermembrane recepter protein